MSRRATLALALGLVAPALPLAADVVVNTSLTLSSLTITPSSGSIEWIHPLSASAFVEALDSLGGFDQHFGSAGDAAVSLGAATSLASANGSADAVSMVAAADSHILIPNISASASATARGQLSGSFKVVGATAPVNVGISAVLSGGQDLSISGGGVFASSELIFNFLLPDVSGTPLITADSLIVIPPPDSVNQPYGATLSNSVLLDPDTEYRFIAEVDSESSGYSEVPEPSSWALLLTTALFLFARRKRQ